MPSQRDMFRKKKPIPPAMLNPEPDPDIVPKIKNFLVDCIRADILKKLKRKGVVELQSKCFSTSDLGIDDFNCGLWTTRDHYKPILDELVAAGFIYESNGYYSREFIAISNLEAEVHSLLSPGPGYEQNVNQIQSDLREELPENKIQTALDHLEALGLVHHAAGPGLYNRSEWPS